MIRYLLLLSALCCTFIAAHAQIKQPVLKWQTRYDFLADSSAFYLSDSATYSYSGNRNAVGNKQEPIAIQYRFDTSIHYVPMPDPTQTFTVIKPYYREAQSFDNNDSTHLFYFDLYDVNGIPQKTQKKTYTYNSDKTIASEYTETYNNTLKTYTPVRNVQYAYNPAGQLMEITNANYNATSGTWQNDTRDSFAYDGQNRLVWKKNDVYFTPPGAYTNYYTLVYAYNSNGLLSSDSFYSSNTSISVNVYNYNSTGLLNKVSQNYYDPFQTFSWKPLGITEYTYNTGNSLSETVNSSWDAVNMVYIPGLKISYAYNNTNQLVRREENLWANGSWQDQAYMEWHYETPSAVKDGLHTSSALILYPVPATTYINVEMNFDKTTNFSVAIVDMQGRVVKQFTDNAKGPYKKHVTVQDMPAGQYMLQVKTADETMSRNFTVIQ